MKILIILSIIFITAFPAYSKNKEPDLRVKYTASEYLKNYALVTCFGNAYKNEKNLQKDLSDAAAAYIELGSFGIEAYNDAFALSQSFLEKIYSGKNGEKLTAMKCVDLFHSKELKNLVKKYEKLEKGVK